MLSISRLLSDNKGSAMILALVAMLFFGTTGAAVWSLSTSNVKTSAHLRDDIAAQYLAEAGAQWALLQLKANSDFTTTGNGVTSEEKNKGSATAGTYTVKVTGDATSKTITSKGTVNKSTRTVVLTVTPGGSGGNGVANGDVFSKYSVFSGGKLQIDNNPKITGDIGSNGTITVSSHSPLIHGTAYTPYVPVMDQWTWNKDAVTGGYQYADPAGTLSISIPAMPAIAPGGTTLPSTSSKLSDAAYYYNGNYTMHNIELTADSGNKVTIYIEGDLKLSGTSKIIGDDVTIYTTGNIILGNDTSIQASNLEIYTQGTFQLTNNASITGNTVFIRTRQSIDCNSNSSINKGAAESAVTKIYSNGTVQCTNNFTIGGTGLVVTSSTVNLNCSGNAEKTVVVSGNGQSQVTNSFTLAGMYTTGTLSINTSPTIKYDSSVIQRLGLGSATFEVTLYSDKE